MFARYPDVSPNEPVPAQFNDSDFETEAELPPLESFISKDILRKLKPKDKKWQEVVNGKHLVIKPMSQGTMISRPKQKCL